MFGILLLGLNAQVTHHAQSVIRKLPSILLSKQQLGCRFDIMDYESYFFVF